MSLMHKITQFPILKEPEVQITAAVYHNESSPLESMLKEQETLNCKLH